METTPIYTNTLLIMIFAIALGLGIIWLTKQMRKKIEPTHRLSYHEALHDIWRAWDVIEDARIKLIQVGDQKAAGDIDQIQRILKEMEVYIQYKMDHPDQYHKLTKLPMTENNYEEKIPIEDVRFIPYPEDPNTPNNLKTKQELKDS
jgi:flagellar biogenesis protein FliO